MKKQRWGCIFLTVLSCVVLFAGCATTEKETVTEQDVQSESNGGNDVEEEGNTNAAVTGATDSSDLEQENEEDDMEKEETSISETQLQATIPEISVSEKEVPENNGTVFVQNMNVGWNLGNTFDAFNDASTPANELDTESSWVGIKTSQEMIDAIRDAGYDTIRIPVTWHNHMDEEFNISEAWMNRVQEVVDYAIQDGLYVIINIHHDTQEGYYYPDYANLETSTKYITRVWEQISERFKDYDEKLIFESINEPRLVGTNYEWWLDMNQDICKEAVDCINQLNQTFVDVVRASGGNNDLRYLMVPGYAASANFEIISEFKFPTETGSGENRILLSTHAYTPYNFALQAQTESGAVSTFNLNSSSSTADIDWFMNELYNKFIKNGIPVVIGEYGARDKNGNLQDRVDYAAYYTAKAESMGICSIWWDNNAFNTTGENFGLIERKTLTWIYPEIVAAVMKYAE